MAPGNGLGIPIASWWCGLRRWGGAGGILEERGGEWARADAMPGTELMGGGFKK